MNRDSELCQVARLGLLRSRLSPRRQHPFIDLCVHVELSMLPSSSVISSFESSRTGCSLSG
nr:MAG TPA: hypothetical protein [Caudoviricetes sp.]